MQGASPLASPGAEPQRHLFTLPLWHLKGGLPSLSPANSAFSFLFFPHPPYPLPLRGRGRLKVISCKGLRPLHPRGLNPRGTGRSGGERSPAGWSFGNGGITIPATTSTTSRKVLGGRGDSFKSPPEFSPPQHREKFWGGGGLFQESPGALLTADRPYR